MDARRFDTLAKALAAPRTRRRAVRVLVGVLLGGIGAAAGRGTTGAAPGAGGCRRAGRRCGGDRECCGNLVCAEEGDARRCVPGPRAACRNPQEICFRDAECCSRRCRLVSADPPRGRCN